MSHFYVCLTLNVSHRPLRSTHAAQHRGGKMRMQEADNDHQALPICESHDSICQTFVYHLCRCFNTSPVLKLPFMSPLPVYCRCESSYLSISPWLMSSVSLVITQNLRHTFVTTTWPLEIFFVFVLFLTPTADFLELFLT